jgi:hypothetical protein
VGADLRYDAALASRPIALGGRLAYYDAIERDGPSGSADHDCRTADAQVVLTLRGEAGHRASASLGLRAFEYKPDARYDFAGEHLGLSWRKLWEGDGGDDSADDAGSLELSVDYELRRRAYDDTARVNGCAGGSLDTDCLAQSELPRVDLSHEAAVELVFTGARILGARYALTVNLSNSFGQSLVRHRVELSLTTETWLGVFLTAKAVVQVNQFLDPLLLDRDIGLLTIEDENRNSLTMHFTRELGGSFVGEARYSFYSNEFATRELLFRRQTAYAGLLYRFD